MSIELILSVLTLAGAIWAARFLLPKAIRDHDLFEIVSALLVVLVALLAWLFLGVPAR